VPRRLDQPRRPVFERNGVGVVVDEISPDLLAGAEIDFVEDPTGASRINNPNAASSGQSPRPGRAMQRPSLPSGCAAIRVRSPTLLRPNCSPITALAKARRKPRREQ